MSGHSKWHTIKHKKGAADAKRGKVFTRIIKELTVAARAGGGDIDSNPRLRTIVAEAKSVNMPADNIKRAIQRGTGELPGVSYEEITYEGYGPGGAALIIETLTDNKNRTVGEMRHLLGKYGGNLAAENSVAWMFDKKGYIVVDKAKTDEDALMAAALDAGADDLRDDGDSWEVVSAPDAFQKVLEAVKGLGVEPGAAEIAFLPQNYVKLEGKPAQQMVKLMDAIEEHEDTKKVWSNADIEEKEIEASLGVKNFRDRSRLGAHRLRLHRIVGQPPPPRHLRHPLRSRPLDISGTAAGDSRRPQALLERHRPECVAVENIFFAKNVRSALKLGHARGVALLAASQASIPVVEYSPAEIKRSVVGYGRAEKQQVQAMMKLLLGLDAVPSPHDVADALAVAICHIHTSTNVVSRVSRRRRGPAARRPLVAPLSALMPPVR